MSVGIELTFSSDDNTVVGNRVLARQAGIRETVSVANTLVGNDVTVAATEPLPTRTRAGTPEEAVVTGSTERSDPPVTGPDAGLVLVAMAVVAALVATLAWIRSRPPAR